MIFSFENWGDEIGNVSLSAGSFCVVQHVQKIAVCPSIVKDK
jgi:hypothetical protein